MAKGLIDELYDLSAIESQQAKVEGLIKELVGGLKNVPKIKLEVEGSKSVKEFSLANAKLQEELKAVTALAKQRFAADAKVITLQTQYAKATAAAREELRKQNRELKTNAEFQAAETASIDKARAAVKKLTQERNSLNLATADGQGKRDALNERINKLNEFIKKNVDLLAQQKINVGNYAGSLAKPFESLQNKLEQIRADLAKGIGLGGGTDVQSLKQAEVAITAINNAISISSTPTATAAKQVRALENAYQALSLTTAKGDGQTNTFLKNFASEIGEAKDSVQDLRDEIKLNASDTKGLDNLVGSLNLLSAGAQAAAGTYALFGATQEEQAALTAKLIAVQGIANSIQTVGQELTKKGTIANRAYVFVQGLLATTTDASAAATTRLAAASKLLLGGAIIGALAFLVIKFIDLKNAISDAAENAKTLKDINKQIAQNAGPEIGKLQALYKAATNANIPLSERKNAVDKLQDQYPAYFKNLSQEEILQGRSAAAYKKTKDAILEAAKARAIESKLGELASEELERQEARKEVIERRQKNAADKKKADAKDNRDSETRGLDQFNAISEGTRITSELFKVNEDLEKIQKRRQFLLDQITSTGDTNINTAPSNGGGASPVQQNEISDNTAADILRTQFEINKLKLEAAAEGNKRIFEDEERTYEQRISALREFGLQQVALIELERNFAKAQEELKLQDIIKSLEKQKKEKGANISAINEQEAKERAASAKRIELIELEAITKLGDQQRTYTDYLKELAKQRQDTRDAELQKIKDFEQDQLEIRERYRKKFQEAAAEAKEQEKEQLKQQNEQIKDATKALYNELQATITAFITDGITREENALTIKQQLLDEETQRRINQINLLGLSEQERTRQIAIVEKNAAAQNEQIERRRRQLAVERARFEKFASISSIIQATAQAVMAALGARPYGPQNIALASIAGATGALQLAKAISSPLPKYKDGRGPGKEELAITGDGGVPEYIIGSRGVQMTPAVPTLTHLMKDDIVLKDKDALITHLLAASNPLAMMAGKSSAAQSDVMTNKTGQRIVSAIEKSVPRVTIINKAPIETTAGWQQAFKG